MLKLLIFISLFYSLHLFSQKTESKIDVYDSIILNKNKITLYKSTQSDFENVSNTSDELDTTYILKTNNTLIFKIDNGKTIILKDTINGDEDRITYNNKGYLDNVNVHVVLVNEIETGEYIIINNSNGEIYKVWGEPYFFEDKIHFISFSDALGYDVMPNGFQFCKLTADGKMEILWEYKIEKFIPLELKIIYENNLLIKGLVPGYLSRSKMDEIIYLKMQMVKIR